MDEKLDRTLNERLDTNFKMVGDQLGKLYRSLGELEALSSGVTDLNRTLSNVKTRGVWGEVQLGRILEQTMARSQYEMNVATKKNSDDRVEFAVRFPSQDGTDDSVYLPIDAKFPSDLYNRIVEASENGDASSRPIFITGSWRRPRTGMQSRSRLQGRSSDCGSLRRQGRSAISISIRRSRRITRSCSCRRKDYMQRYFE